MFKDQKKTSPTHKLSILHWNGFEASPSLVSNEFMITYYELYFKC